jgi:UDP-glucose 4-epimerase
VILVTGANGVVGRAVCAHLTDVQVPFLPLVHSKEGHTPKNAIVGDLTEATVLGGISGITAVVHLAAAVPHTPDYPDTRRSAEMTRMMDRVVYDFCCAQDLPAVYMSTCGLYDRTNPARKRETDQHLIKAVSPYFEAKLAGESLFTALASFTVLRLAAPVGPGLPLSLVLSRFLFAAFRGQAVEVWGTGKREQSFIDVRDVASIVLKAVASPACSTINVAASGPTSMLELAQTAVNAMGQGVVKLNGASDPNEGHFADFSIQAAERVFGWRPTIQLEDSCRYLLSVEPRFSQ